MGFWSNVGKRRMKRMWLPRITVKSHQYQDEIIPNPLSFKPHIFVYVRTFQEKNSAEKRKSTTFFGSPWILQHVLSKGDWYWNITFGIDKLHRIPSQCVHSLTLIYSQPEISAEMESNLCMISFQVYSLASGFLAQCHAAKLQLTHTKWQQNALNKF